jgi:hypothetical protein
MRPRRHLMRRYQRWTKNSSCTSARSLIKTLQTPFTGGWRSNRAILVSLAWQLISLPSLVSTVAFPTSGFLLHLIGTSIDVERLFSRGRLVLSHTRGRLTATSTRALLCLGSWSSLGLIRDEDLEGVGKLDEIDGRIELERVSKVLQGLEVS